MSEPRGDRVLPVVLSILIHAAIVGALVWGWWQYRAPTPPPQTLPRDLIEEGHTIPIARVVAMHEGKRRARSRRAASND